MRLLLSGFTLLVALGLVAPVGDAAAPKLPKPPDYVSASVDFRDDPGDAISSDNLGDYVDGTPSGLAVLMWTCPDCTQDLTLNTQAGGPGGSGGPSGRTIGFDYRNKVTGSGTGPIGMMFDNAFMNIRDIAAMDVGETKITLASFATAIGRFQWRGAPPPTTRGWVADESYGSQAVEVWRVDVHTWRISTPVPPVLHQEGADDYFAGDLSVLLIDGKRNTVVPIGLYHMPFGLTVTCDSCH